MEANLISYLSVFRAYAFLLSTFHINFFILPPRFIAMIKHCLLICLDLLECSLNARKTQLAITLDLALKCFKTITLIYFYRFEALWRACKADRSIFTAIFILNYLICSKFRFSCPKTCLVSIKSILCIMFSGQDCSASD